MRQTCRCCSLIQAFSRVNHWRASRRGELVNSVISLASVADSPWAVADLVEAAKCQFSRGGWRYIG